MTPPPQRCHLLIGPPASGKTTLARDLAPLLVGENGGPALVLSTDANGATPSDVARMPQ
jgi:tRNA uridine 5-carbamoylmethylation protein Kti12